MQKKQQPIQEHEVTRVGVSKAAFQKVFLIKVGNEVASSFLIVVDGRDYLVTVNHLFKAKTLVTNTEVEFELFRDGKWIRFMSTALLHKNPSVDLVVIDLKTSNQKQIVFNLETKFTLAQECFFLGFPYGQRLDDDKLKPINRGFPIAFVKSATISSVHVDSLSVTHVILDGINNPGFSGGPAVSNRQNDKMDVSCVVSGYLLDQATNANTGLIDCVSIHHVLEIISAK